MIKRLSWKTLPRKNANDKKNVELQGELRDFLIKQAPIEIKFLIS